MPKRYKRAYNQRIQRDAKEVPKRDAKKKCQKEVCQRDTNEHTTKEYKDMPKRCKRAYNQSIQRNAKEVPKRGAKKGENTFLHQKITRCQRDAKEMPKICQRDDKEMKKSIQLDYATRAYNQSIQPEHTKRCQRKSI